MANIAQNNVSRFPRISYREGQRLSLTLPLGKTLQRDLSRPPQLPGKGAFLTLEHQAPISILQSKHKDPKQAQTKTFLLA